MEPLWSKTRLFNRHYEFQFHHSIFQGQGTVATLLKLNKVSAKDPVKSLKNSVETESSPNPVDLVETRNRALYIIKNIIQKFRSYLSFWHEWHRHPVTLSFVDLLIQTQHFLQTPKLQSMHSSLRLKSSENPSPHRTQILWLKLFCFASKASISLWFWADDKSASTCLKNGKKIVKMTKKVSKMTLRYLKLRNFDA